MTPPDTAALDDAYVVSVGRRHTRRTFYCYVNASATHWTFVDADFRAFQGPAFAPIDHEFQLHHLVADWWADQRLVSDARSSAMRDDATASQSVSCASSVSR